MPVLLLAVAAYFALAPQGRAQGRAPAPPPPSGDLWGSVASGVGALGAGVGCAAFVVTKPFAGICAAVGGTIGGFLYDEISDWFD